jgi:hypothetical protein
MQGQLWVKISGVTKCKVPEGHADDQRQHSHVILASIAARIGALQVVYHAQKQVLNDVRWQVPITSILGWAG